MSNGLIIYSLESTKGFSVMIDWDTVINQVHSQEGTSVTTDPSYWDTNNPHYGEVYRLWNEAKFNHQSIKWINYYPVKNYDKIIETTVAQNLNVNPIRSWISRIDPGYYAPWHWDIDDKEEEYKQLGNLVRYTVFIDKPKLGQVFILTDKYYFEIEQGTTLEWPNYTDWHIGINGGLSPYYMFHLLGYK